MRRNTEARRRNDDLGLISGSVSGQPVVVTNVHIDRKKANLNSRLTTEESFVVESLHRIAHALTGADSSSPRSPGLFRCIVKKEP